MKPPNAWLIACAAALLSTRAAGEEPVDYATQIKPLFDKHCVACHGVLRKQGGLRLDAAQFLRTGGDSGEAVTPGDPTGSVLVAALKGEGGYARMPKDADALPPADLALIERWITEGAVAPESEAVAGDPATHWSFQPVKRQAVPRIDAASNPIDAFIRVNRESVRLAGVGPAPKHVLLRRAYLDLVGLPPSPEALRAYLADSSPDAYERVVDRLLADPRHGERWGRHWMDVWRYSDWYGYDQELRNSQKHVWRWRDWIVESLNAGKGYDRMVVEMLAADEVAPEDEDALRATGYLARNYYKFNRDVWLDKTVEHTGKAFLGLTFNCAKCHDHMFDPIAQRDYYALKAVFAPYHVRIDPVGGVLDENAAGLARAYDKDAAAVTYLFVRGNDKTPDKDNPIPPTLPTFFVPRASAPAEIPLPPASYYPGLRADVRATLRRQVDAEVATADEAMRPFVLASSEPVSLQADGSSHAATLVAPKPWPTAQLLAEAKQRAARAKRTSLEARIVADDARYASAPNAEAESLAITAAKAERAAAVANADADATAAWSAFAAARAKPEAERPKAIEDAMKSIDAARKAVETAHAEAMKTDGDYSSLTAAHPATSTGRRTALANWIADPSNPLTARVAVNHVWMRHFGKPLVRTVFDFGMHGTPPTHPELLDWLAAEFVASGWDMKHLHRLIVTSETYRLDSAARAGHPSLAADPDNLLYWRMNARRAEGEVVRDSLLATSGRLVERIGGPELDSTTDQTTARRSLYYRHAPEKYAPFLMTFDGASADECYRRAETVVPQQALAQVNSRLSREQSRLLAAELTADGSRPTEELIGSAFERVLCRPPDSEERAACAAFLTEQEARLADPAKLTAAENGPDVAVPAAESPEARAFADLVHVLMNHHDFVTIR